MDAIEQALESGLKFTGATVHVVTAAVDGGPILVQDSVPILESDTVETLRQRVHEVEYRILPEGIRLMEEKLAGSRPVR
jgi:folate-dependent phosphoribosylglycinamide formyltransferase PurN